MKKGKMSLLLLSVLLSFCVIASQAGAQPFVLSKVVDKNTPIPGGSGNFTDFPYGYGPPYAVSGGNVAFQARGQVGQYGIYLFDGTTLTRVVDYNTSIPGGSGNFTIFLSDGPMISGNNVTFHGGGGSGQDGIYLFNGTTLSVVADTNTPIPSGSGDFTSFDNFYNPVISGNKIALRGYGVGQWGIYLFNGSSLNKIADYNTPVPEGTGNFVSFSSLAISGGNVAFGAGGAGQDGIYLFNGTSLTKVVDYNTPPWSGSLPTFSAPVISSGNVAFRAGNAELTGIYLFNGSTLNKVADTNTPIPGGSGNFTSFSAPAISGSIVVFRGSEYGGPIGIYLFNGTTLSKVADTSNTPIPGGSGNFTSFSAPAISDGNVAFWGAGTGESGIYLFNGTTLSKVADTNTPIPSGSGNFTGFFDPVIDDGKIVFGAAGAGQYGFYLATSQTHPVDFDGDRKTDITIYRSNNGAWYIYPSGGSPPYGVGWGGAPYDKPVPGDYDGDGQTDIAIYRISDGGWYVIPSSTPGTPYGVAWGGDTSDVPVHGDYDGDGKTDVAIYRTTSGGWYIIPSSTPGTPYSVGWGGDASDKPVPGDYDGDGKTDIAIYRTSTGGWYIIPSDGGSPYGMGWGGDGTDLPVTTNPALYM